MVRFSEEVFGSANRFVSENDHKANAPACHSQYKLIEAIRIVTIQTKAATTSTAASKALQATLGGKFSATSPGRTPSEVEEIKKLLLSI